MTKLIWHELSFSRLDFHPSAKGQPEAVGTHRGTVRPEPTNSPIPVIVLANLPYSHQGLQVLVGLVRVDVVQGTAVPGVPV